MAKLSIKTNLKKVYIVGEFNRFDLQRPLVAEKQKNNQYINIENMPIGEYSVYATQNIQSCEVYPITKRLFVTTRYFSGEIKHEYIRCYFNIGGKAQ